MKTLSVLISFLIISISAMPQGLNKRGHIEIPAPDGFIILKCDFHIHTVFSDGDVWPTFRIEEAWRNGLDAIAITDHIEYQAYKGDVLQDHNRAYEIAKPLASERGILLIKGGEITRKMPPGHLNAIFAEDVNKLDSLDLEYVLNEAKRQKAFVFWNHPGWSAQQPDSTVMFDMHKRLIKEGIIKGIEVANSHSYYPEAYQWCIDNNLTLFGNSDMHHPESMEFELWQGEHRPITLVFAKEKSVEGIKEALLEHRTAVYFENKIIGAREFLLPIFNKSIKITVLKKNQKFLFLQMKNLTDLTLSLSKNSPTQSYKYPREITIKPKTLETFYVSNYKGEPEISLDYIINNFLVAPNKGLEAAIIVRP